MSYPKTVVRYGKSTRHAAYPLMGGKEYETACGWRWKEHECALDSAEPDCANCRSFIEVWEEVDND